MNVNEKLHAGGFFKIRYRHVYAENIFIHKIVYLYRFQTKKRVQFLHEQYLCT